MKHLLVVLVIFALSIFSDAEQSYEGYKVYSVSPTSKQQADYLIKLEKPLDLDYWSHPRTLEKDATVMVPPKMQNAFERLLKLKNIPFQTIINNVQASIEAENQQMLSNSYKTLKGNASFTTFMRHADINSYLDTLAETYPSIVSVETIGQSYENRDLKLVRINSGSTAGKPTIFIDAGIHAREWIAPPVALYVINQLVENSTNAALYQNVNWIVLPVVNPDGYEYTHTTQRLWRKTRSRGTLCYGTDGNRNFGFHWMEEGASSNECSETFAGREAFSEVEAQALRDFLLENNQDGSIKLYFTFHSYGQYVLYPWGYSNYAPDPFNLDELVSVGNSIRSAIYSVRGTDYFVGNSAKDLYPAAGASDDWAMGVANISLSYTIELPGGGSAGFNPPTTEILPVVRETWQGILVAYRHVVDSYFRQ